MNSSDTSTGTTSSATAQPASAIGAVSAQENTVAGHDRLLKGEVLASSTAPTFLDGVRQLGFNVIQTRQLEGLGFSVARLQTPSDLTLSASIAELKARFPDIKVDADHIYQTQGSFAVAAPNFPVKAIKWPTMPADCPKAPPLGIIDAHVDNAAPDLAGVTLVSSDFSEQLATPVAHTNHGTAIATLLAGRNGSGLLPGAPIYAASIFREDSDGLPVATAIGFVEALNWMVENHVSIVNVSLSGPANELMQQAVAQAVARGIRIVAAVGNDHLVNVGRFPAAYPDVIGVTAVDSRHLALKEANQGNYVSFSAPGVDIWIPGLPAGQGTASGAYYTGTSFAAPYVTATLALFNGDARRMQAAVVDLGAPGFDPVYGWGLVQANAACKKDVALQ